MHPPSRRARADASAAFLTPRDPPQGAPSAVTVAKALFKDHVRMLAIQDTPPLLQVSATSAATLTVPFLEEVLVEMAVHKAGLCASSVLSDPAFEAAGVDGLRVP